MGMALDLDKILERMSGEGACSYRLLRVPPLVAHALLGIHTNTTLAHSRHLRIRCIFIYIIRFKYLPFSYPSLLLQERPTVRILKKFHGKGGTFNILERIGPHYRVVGTFILEDIDGSVVTNLADIGRRNPYNISHAIVQRWLETGGERTTFETLVSCLRDAELNTLAKDIEDKVGENNKGE